MKDSKDRLVSRRGVLACAAAAAVAGMTFAEPLKAANAPARARVPFKQGVTRGVLGGSNRSVDECCRIAASLGARGIDFFSNPADWPTLKRYGLVCSMYRSDYGGAQSDLKRVDSPSGWNEIGLKEAQGEFLTETLRAIDLAADNGVPNVILLAGTRHKVTYEEGATNAVAFCNQVKARAESRGVTLCMELLNSAGVQAPSLSLFDHAEWGFNVVRQVGSPRVKVLYDVFHAQMMEGNIVDTLRKNIALIGHIHLGGVPGRHDLDETQELNFRLIGRTIADLGFGGFVTHEWNPAPDTKDQVAALRRSMAIIDGTG